VIRFRLRLAAALCAAGLTVPLVTAARLEPDRHGYGTHQQLGLPPCTSIVLFGCRCPACGMTTSWAHLLHGNVRAALAANVAGACLAVVTAVAVLWLGAGAIGGRWLWTPNVNQAAAVALAIATLACVQWIWRLAAG
jgi:hypothetical protein